MLPFGHISASYLISQTRKESRTNLKAIALIIFAGLLFDVDFILLPFFGYIGGLHHYFAGHTPLVGIFYFVFLYFLFRKRFSKTVLILAGIALFTHLVLDDLSYWFSVLGIENQVVPQIFWLYPFDPRRNIELQKFLEVYDQKILTNQTMIAAYIKDAPKLFWLEIVLTLSAILVFLRSLGLDKKRLKS